MAEQTKSEKTLQVYIDSTDEDLKEYREEVQDTILSLGFQPIMMEHFAIMDKKAEDDYLDKVRSVDIYIGIFAYRYGNSLKDSEISIIETELNEATLERIPCLCFMVDDELELDARYIREPDRQKLETLKAQFNEDVIFLMFKSLEHLGLQVLKSLFILNNADLQSFKDTENHRLLNKRIRSMLEVLKPRERKVLEKRFGLDDGQGRALEEVGALFGVARERIRQLEVKGLCDIRKHFNYLEDSD